MSKISSMTSPRFFHLGIRRSQRVIRLQLIGKGKHQNLFSHHLHRRISSCLLNHHKRVLTMEMQWPALGCKMAMPNHRETFHFLINQTLNVKRSTGKMTKVCLEQVSPCTSLCHNAWVYVRA